MAELHAHSYRPTLGMLVDSRVEAAVNPAGPGAGGLSQFGDASPSFMTRIRSYGELDDLIVRPFGEALPTTTLRM